MEHRTLGRTGVSVSKLCLGAMMFGAWGNPDHDESIRDHPRRARRRDQLRRHRRRLRARRVRGDRRQGARRRPARRRRAWPPSSTTRWARTPTSGQLPPLDHPRGRGLAAPARHRLDRPLPGPPPDARHRHRGDARRAHRPRAPGQGPLHRLLDLPGQPDRRGAVGRARPASRAVRHRAAALLDPRPRDRGRRPARPARATAWASCPTAR